MRISDWSSDVCSSDLPAGSPVDAPRPAAAGKPAATSPASTYRINAGDELEVYVWGEERLQRKVKVLPDGTIAFPLVGQIKVQGYLPAEVEELITNGLSAQYVGAVPQVTVSVVVRSEEHTSELQSLMRISYAVFFLKKKTKT